VEVVAKNGLRDAAGEGARGEIELLGEHVDAVTRVDFYGIDKELPQDKLDLLGRELFSDPLTQDFLVDRRTAEGRDWDWLVHVKKLPGAKDGVGERAAAAIRDILGDGFEPGGGVYTATQYLIKGKLTPEQVQRIARDALGYASVESWDILDRKTFDEKGYTPEVPRVVIPHEPGMKYIDLWLDGDELQATVRHINEKRAKENKPPLKIETNAEWLDYISSDRYLALNQTEMQEIKRHFSSPEIRAKRAALGLDEEPTDVEMETLAQTWSEHCKHKIFNARVKYKEKAEDGTWKVEEIDSLFRTYIKATTKRLQAELPWVVSTLWDNSGVMDFNERYYFAFKCETHNSPSAKYPYGGAITGIVGVYRDPMGTGRGVILVYGTYGFCTAVPFQETDLEPEIAAGRMLEGIRKGVEHGGNKHGVPTPCGQVTLDEGFAGKPGVYVLAAGLIPKVVNGEPGYEKAALAGDLIVMCGGRVGIDGIHGATESSMEGGEHITLGHVQMGDPFTQKKMHDFLNEARDRGLYRCIQDCGAGGLSSAVGEMGNNFGREGGARGCRMYLDRVPLKYHGLDFWQIDVSESQERMVISMDPSKWDELRELAELHDVEITNIGELTDSGQFHILYGDKTVASIDMDFLHDGVPQMELEAEWASPEERGLKEPILDRPEDYGLLLRNMLARPNICGKEYLIRQFDHEVQGTSVIKPLVGRDSDVNSDGSVIRPDLTEDEEGKKAIAMTVGINPKLSQIDTYHMATNAFDEAVRRVLALGGDMEQIAMNDNFVWPSPLPGKDNPDATYKMAQLVRANRGLSDAELAYKVPCISGKDSMSMDTKMKRKDGTSVRVSAPPTLQMSAAGKINDWENCITMDAKDETDLVYVLGMTKDECGASEYYEMLGEVGRKVPVVDFGRNLRMYKAFSNAVKSGLVKSAHGCYKGGLGVALAQAAFAGGFGMYVDLGEVPVEGVDRDDKILFSESAGRFVVTVDATKVSEFEAAMEGHDYRAIGMTTGDNLRLRGLDGREILNENIYALKDAWRSTFRRMEYHPEEAAA